jgi:magnesium chelatase subunit I
VKESQVAARVLPYSRIVGQKQLKCALELSFIEPRITGVLISGERGSGKSTTVRAFSQMIRGRLPVTLPINATEDRVVGGWDVGELLKSKPQWKQGLLQDAHDGMLYVDEVNLLDDQIVNIILDVTASGLLAVERDSHADTKEVRFSLVGTMNPEEGTLRPQLLDRFGLMVDVRGLTDAQQRREVLATVLDANNPKDWTAAQEADHKIHQNLVAAKKAAARVKMPQSILDQCVSLADRFRTDGHRGDYMLALAVRALAASLRATTVTSEHLRLVAPLALQHRRRVAGQREFVPWSDKDDDAVNEIIGRVES